MPTDLPIPHDDGACQHLQTGHYALPSITLPPTSDPSRPIDLSTLPGLTILFIYPRTGRPDESIPAAWDAIPGARGCTPQACSYRDNLPDLQRLGVAHVFGMSTQDSAYQAEVRQRTHLPYDLLSDEKRQFQTQLSLPTIEWEGSSLTRRITLAVRDGVVVKCWYPVSVPSDRDVHGVLAWLRQQGERDGESSKP